ncbi:MAG: hypothetical protein ACI8ZB_005280 [Desulforhopalus sp.]|jgi:hypothetical protein
MKNWSNQPERCRKQPREETLSVHLGPGWYIERLDDPIIPGDVIEVSGSRVTVQGQLAIIATRIKKGAALLILRNDLGIPAWSGWQDTIEREDVGETREEQRLNNLNPTWPTVITCKARE